MKYEIRNTKYERRTMSDERRAFTLIELVVAIGLLSIVLVFSGVIFKASIGSYRTASAQAEIMRKLRVITEQLDSDFQGLQKDGFLILRSEIINRREYPSDALAKPFRADRIYFFCTGDFQSWFPPYFKSNIARIYFGHEFNSLDLAQNVPVNRWRLARDAQLICPGVTIPAPPPVVDYNNISFAGYKADPTRVVNEADAMLASPPGVVMSDPNTIGRLFCENAGQMAIEWTDGTKDPNSAIAWFGFAMSRSSGGTGIPGDSRYSDAVYGPIEIFSPYRARWTSATPNYLWPQALKFTFTLYDSRGVFKGGQTFTHIVYIGQ